MQEDTTTVLVTVQEQHEPAYLKFLGREPDLRGTPPRQGLASLAFRGWNRPEAARFHCPGIPFVGHYGAGASHPPRRMCGDGETAMEVFASPDGRLYVFVDEPSGFPEWRSDDEVRAYLSFERECRELMNPPQGNSIG